MKTSLPLICYNGDEKCVSGDMGQSIVGLEVIVTLKEGMQEHALLDLFLRSRGIEFFDDR